MKKVTTISLLVVCFFVIAFTVFVDIFLDKDNLSEVREPVYERTESLIDDINEKEPEFIYSEYFSSDVRNEYTRTEWRGAYNKIQDSDLYASKNAYDLNKESLSQKTNLIGDGPDRYSINVLLNIEEDREVETVFEWVKNNGDLKLQYLELPFEIHNNEPRFMTFGIQQ